MKLYILAFLLFLSLIAKANDKKEYITINVHFNSAGLVRLRYYDDYLVEKTLTFKSSPNGEAITTQKIFSNSILELRYSVFDGGTNKHYFKIFFVKPGDNIHLQYNQLSLKALGNNPLLFVSDFLKIDDSIFAMKDGEGGLKSRAKLNNDELNSNLKIIDALRFEGKVSNEIAEIFAEIAYNSFYVKQIRLNYNAGALELDTLAETIKLTLAKKTNINSSFLNNAIYSIVSYNRVKKNLSTDIYAFVKQVIDIKTEKRFKTGVIFEALSDFPEKTSKIYTESYALFLEKLSESAFRAEGYADKLIPNKTAFDKSKVKLTSVTKRQLTLDAIFIKNKGKWLLLDFWASWCIPCINEFPYLESAKIKLKDKNIVFIGIGLDKDNKEKDWLSVLNKAKISHKNQFRVLENFNKTISQIYKIEMIPRYLLFDTNGVLVNSQFVKPSSKDFVEQLLRNINTY